MRNLTTALKEKANPEKAKVLQRFFKTGKGQYGEKDIFLGLMVPETRMIAKEFSDINLKAVELHLDSKYHEERLAALLILVEKFKKADNKKEIYDFYCNNVKKVNNWDLVDLSADKIVGAYLIDKDKKILYKMANSDNLWERRVAIISTFAFVKSGKFEECFKVSELLLNDEHDLIHKAVGWMLREVGKRDQEAEEKFLKKHYKKMPRTMLRYAIEKFPEDLRARYLRGKI